MNKTCLFITLLGLSLVAQADSILRRQVVETRVISHGGIIGSDPKEYILVRVSGKEGAFVSDNDLARDERDLLASGTFSNVTISKESKDDGLIITYNVEVAPRFREITKITGASKFSERKVKRLLDLTNGERIDTARLDIKLDKLREEYRKSYYYDVKIEATILEPDKEGFSNIEITITEGESARIIGFEFSGNEAFTSADLSHHLGKPSWYNPVPFFFYTWRSRALNFEHVRDELTTLYRNAGYLDVEIAPPSLVDSQDGKLLLIKINEGPQYKVGEITFSGATIYPTQKLEQIVRHTVKDIANEDAINYASRALRNYYTERGYADTSVRPKIRPQSSDTVSVDFAIRENDLCHVRSVSIRGNSVTKDKVIRRELIIRPGEILNEVAAERSKNRIENLGYFENVRYYETPSLDDPTSRDLIYEVEEKGTGNLMVGIGTSSADDIMGFMEISQNNFDILNFPTFRGGGQKAKLGLNIGSDSNTGEITWSDPWFLDRRQNLGVSLYRREIGFNEYDETRIGGDVSLTFDVIYGRISARLGAELVKVKDIIDGTYTLYDDPTQSFSFTDMDDSYMRIPLRLTWNYDTRDRAFVPTRGTRNSIFTELTSSSLGSDYDLYRIGIDLREYIPLWFDHVLSLHLRGEVVDAYGDTTEIPITESLYVGGSRTIRGVKYRQAGPKAIPSGDTYDRARPVGGSTLLLASAEYAIPLASVLRVATFIDAGNVWEKAFDCDLGEYAASYGFGLRLDIPGFPIRIDYAIPVKDDDKFTRREHFIFWIGFD